MKKFILILVSYLQRPKLDLAVLAAAALFFVLGHVFLLDDTKSLAARVMTSWHCFMVAFFGIVYVVAHHLSDLASVESNYLLPDFLRKQLLAGAFFFVIFLFYPLILTTANGFPLRFSVAMFPFALAWTFFWVAIANQKLLALGLSYQVFAILSAMMRIIPEPHDVTLAFIQRIVPEVRPFGSDWIVPVLIAIISMAVFSKAIRKLFRIHRLESTREMVADELLRNFDKLTPLTRRYMSRKLQNIRPGFSALSQALKIRFGLFSPSTISGYELLLGFAGVMVLVLVVLLLSREATTNDLRLGALYMSMLAYMMVGIGVSMDFFQHRSRLPHLWMVSGAKDRKRFLDSTVLSYFLIMLRNTLIATLVLWVILTLLSGIGQSTISLILLIGILTVMTSFAGSLVFTTGIKSPAARGWLVGTVIFFIIVMTIWASTGTPLDWNSNWKALLIISAIMLLIFVLGLINWRKTDFDYIGPD